MKQPIKHTGQPHPKRPNECELCGCHKDEHLRWRERKK